MLIAAGADRLIMMVMLVNIAVVLLSAFLVRNTAICVFNVFLLRCIVAIETIAIIELCIAASQYLSASFDKLRCIGELLAVKNQSVSMLINFVLV